MVKAPARARCLPRSRNRAGDDLQRADLAQQEPLVLAVAMDVEAHPRLLYPLDGIDQPGRAIELRSDAQDAASHGLPAAFEPHVEQSPHCEIADRQRARRRPGRQVFVLGGTCDPDEALRLSCVSRIITGAMFPVVEAGLSGSCRWAPH